MSMLVDIVSKNGNLLVNMVQTPEDICNLTCCILSTLPETGLRFVAREPMTRLYKISGENRAAVAAATNAPGADPILASV